MQASISKDAGKAVIKLSGRFDFNTHREFRNAYEPLIGDAETRAVVVDFSAVDYLDSSALGMLLLLRDYAGGDDAVVRIANPSDDVRKILHISNFQRLFTIQ